MTVNKGNATFTYHSRGKEMWKLIQHFSHTRLFPGTSRQCWMYKVLSICWCQLHFGHNIFLGGVMTFQPFSDDFHVCKIWSIIMELLRCQSLSNQARVKMDEPPGHPNIFLTLSCMFYQAALKFNLAAN